MPKAKILIVEDQVVIATNIKILLKHHGYQVCRPAVNSEDALKILEEESPDLALMDISIPGNTDGIDTAKIIKEMFGIPIIFLSANSDPETVKRAKEVNPAGYLTKDIQLKDQLPIALEIALHSSKVSKERKLSETACSESSNIFRDFVVSSGEAIFVIEKDGTVDYWNPAAGKLFGYSEENAIGNKIFDLIAPEFLAEEFRDVFSNFESTDENGIVGRTVEVLARNRSERVFPIEITLSPFRTGGKIMAGGVARDISARKTAEEELERLIEELHISREIIETNAAETVELNLRLSESQEKLERLNADKDKFFSIISHDLKSPMQGILGFSDLLASNSNEFSRDEITEFGIELRDSARSLYKLLENLLHWSRIQLGKIEFDPENFYPERLAESAISLLKPNADQKGVKLLNKIDSNLIAFGDVNMTDAVIRNLISNAVKFTESGGRVVISAKRIDEGIEIAVEDSGVGIPEDRIDKIFDIDDFKSSKGTDQEEGTGLGLIICKELVEKNGGKINVESGLGEGTKISFTLPAKKNGDI